MSHQLNRRLFLQGSSALLASVAVARASAAQDTAANPAGLQLLSSVDGVNVPPKGGGSMKFSFPWPEPSVPFSGLLFAFEVITFENSYAIDPQLTSVSDGPDGLVLSAGGFTWAGQQERVGGQLEARLQRAQDGAIVWDVSVRFHKPVKAVKTIVRGLPRGRVSAACGEWQDLRESEKVFEYPDLMNGLATPLVALEAPDNTIWAISALQQEVRPARFYFWPGKQNYKIELVYEQAGWQRSGQVRTHHWRIGNGPDLPAAVQPHFQHLQRAYALPAFATRPDAPAWMKQIGLVVSLHGQHWTGHIFNNYARQLDTLKWLATRTDPRSTLVFLAGWDARYYWDYPRFDVDPRMGGEVAFRRLIQEGQALGFRFLLMFGSNIANPAAPGFDRLARARVRTLAGDPMPANFVDWDGDRKGDGTMVFMNLAVSAWRNHLSARIEDMVRRYRIDAYFLDICGLWENNLDGDMFLGVKQLVQGLARRCPGVPAVAEMQYDAQMGIIPMSHAARYPLYPQGNYDHVASFDHLSHPSPGSASTGVHEYGFRTYTPVKVEQRQIPTITFVEDTLDRFAALVEADLDTARRRFEARGKRT